MLLTRPAPIDRPSAQDAAEKEERNRRRAAAAAAAAPLTFEQEQGRHETVFESADRLAQVRPRPRTTEPQT